MAITSFTAAETISASDVVALNSNGLLIKAIASNRDQASAAGVAIDSGVAGSLIRVNTDSVYNGLSSLTPGLRQYLSPTASGSLVDYSTWQTQFGTLTISGVYLSSIGVALTTTAMEVEVQRPIYVTK